MAMTFSDDTVMRYVDGELDDATCVAIEDAQASDPDLAARIEAFAQTKLQARRAMQPLLDEPVPEKLRSTVEAMVARQRPISAGPMPTATPRAAAGAPGARILVPANDWRRLAAAACIAGVLGGLVGYFAVGSPATPGGLQVADVDRAALVDALRTTPSGEERSMTGQATRFTAIASFHDARQSLCREFELDMADGSQLTSVACNEENDWRVRFAVNAPGDGAGYAPASSAEALDAYLTAIEAGAPLSGDDEAQALRALSSNMQE